MTIEEIGPEALRLPMRDRALLAASLWESVEDPFELAVALDDDSANGLAAETEGEMEGSEVKAISHAELMGTLRG
jgi:hypothetical protein